MATWWLIIFVILHIILCFIIYIAVKARVVKFSEQLMPLIIFVPIWGMFLALVADYNSRADKTGSKEIMLDDMHINKKDYRLINVREDHDMREVVPFEDAISLNEVSFTRSLMTDILNQNVHEYLEILQKAKLNSDIEVSHYATTSIMEIQRDFEINLQKAEQLYDEHPEDDAHFDNYLSAVKEYIESNLIFDKILRLYQKKYAELLEIKIQKYPNIQETYMNAIDCYLDMAEYENARRLIEKALVKWNNNEEPWLRKIRLCQQTNEGEAIVHTVNEMKRRHIYLTNEGKEAVMFWNDIGMDKDGGKDAGIF